MNEKKNVKNSRPKTHYSKNEELRRLRGTLGLPGTVAPFRAWRGSRDLVAQSPKFHVAAVSPIRDCLKNVSTDQTEQFSGIRSKFEFLEPAIFRYCLER